MHELIYTLKRHAKMSISECYIANVNPQLLGPIRGKNGRTYPTKSYLSHGHWLLKSLKHFFELAHTSRGSIMTRYPSMQICKVCNENLVEDEYHLLLECLIYKVICEKYDDLLVWHYNLCFTQISNKRVSTCVCALLSHKVFLE